MSLALSVPKDASYLLQPGTKRVDIIAVLGQPHTSTRLIPPVAVTRSDHSKALASSCDEYRVSGLLLTPKEEGAYDNQWSIYPVALMVTGGASEIIALPATIGDLTARSLKRYRLRLWYDQSREFVSYDKR